MIISIQITITEIFAFIDVLDVLLKVVETVETVKMYATFSEKSSFYG